MSNSASSLFPLRNLWLLTIPPLPLVLATALLSSLIDPDKQLAFLKIDASAYVAPQIREYIHLGDMLTYNSLASVHVVVCIGVIGYLVYMIRELPARESRGSILFIVGVSLLVVGLVVYFKQEADHIVLVQLGYKATCMAIEAVKLPTNLVSECFAQDDISKLTRIAWIPTFFGMGTVVFAAGFAYGNAGSLPSFEDPEWRTVFNQRIAALQKSVYALSTVLVSSTLTITLFAHLPVRLLTDSNGLATAVSKYAVGLSTFWGALFSLTLVATFAGPAFLLLRQAYGHESVGKDTADHRVWLHEHVFVSIKKQLVNVASLLAPLLVGPLSRLLSSLAGT